MSTVLYPRQASKWIAETSSDINISENGVKKIAQMVYNEIEGKDDVIDISRWKTHKLNPKDKNEVAVSWIFVVDVLNFCFWTDTGQPKYTVKLNGQNWTGYWSLCAAVNRALEESIPITTASFYANISDCELAHIMRSDTASEMPLLSERLCSLHEAGQVLMQKYDGSFMNVLKQCNGSAQTLLRMIVDDFPSFRDEAVYKGKRVGIYKRAQILVADIWACFGGKGLANFHDIDSITMFADYRVPQVLVWYGALQYSEKLMDMLNKEVLFKSGDMLEVQIRGCSIWAVELIVAEVRKMAEVNNKVIPAGINAILVDHYLWDHRQDYAEKMDDIPIHRIRCIYY